LINSRNRFPYRTINFKQRARAFTVNNVQEGPNRVLRPQ